MRSLCYRSQRIIPQYRYVRAGSTPASHNASRRIQTRPGSVLATMLRPGSLAGYQTRVGSGTLTRTHPYSSLGTDAVAGELLTINNMLC